MKTYQATFACGQLRITCAGEPITGSVCHCLACQRRTGSAFGVQARFSRDQITKIEGREVQFARVADSGSTVTTYFCPQCGSTVYGVLSTAPHFIFVAVGAFADPKFPAPQYSLYEARRHPWVVLAANIEVRS
jgi:hypothetical protein